MNKLIIALILLFFFLGQSVRGQEDNIKVSLMTCAPGTEIYALFGHTALRYEDKAPDRTTAKIARSGFNHRIIVWAIAWAYPVSSISFAKMAPVKKSGK